MNWRITPLIACFLVTSGIQLKAASLCFEPHQADDGRGCWAFEAGVAFMTSNNIGEVVTGDINFDDGAAGAEIYSVTASRRLGQFKLDLWGHTFHPQLEAPFTLEFVDQNSGSSFFNFNASLVVRWEEFPWSDVVSMTVSTGLGLSYSEEIYAMDLQRHPDSDRSRLKFNWPIQVTFALPAYPDHQLMLFLAHKSGGHVFDRGGFNSLGFGYRFSY